MKKLRLLVPVALIVALVLLMMAPAAALAAPNTYGGGGHGGGGHGGGGHGWNQQCSGGWTYVVRCGDTLGDIGWRYGSSAWELARANHIRNPNLIYPGQRLWIPGGCW
jgi:nucleoid-associated protein YgaU